MGPRKLILIPDEDLDRLETRPSLGEYSRELWRRRHFIRADARSKAMTSGRDTFLGKAWVILDPLFQVLLYAFIFGAVLGVSRGIENYVGFLTIGVIFFRICTRGLASGVNLIQKSRSLISSFQFPRASVAFGAALKDFMDSLVPTGVAIVVALALQAGDPVSWTVLLVIPVLIMAAFFVLGTSLIVARATAFVPDLRTPVNLLNRGLFFISGIFFSLDRFENHPVLEAIMTANPVYQFLTVVRTCVLLGEVPPLGVWGYLALWSFGIAAIGYLYFWQAEGRYSSVR